MYKLYTFPFRNRLQMRWTKLRQTCKEIGRRWERFTSNYMAFHTYPSHTLYTQKNIYRIRHRQCLCSVHAPDTTNTNWSTQSQLKIIRALFILVSTAEFIFRFIAWYSRLHAVASPSMEPREIINIFMEKKNAIRKRQIRIKKRAHLEQIVIIILNLSKKKPTEKTETYQETTIQKNKLVEGKKFNTWNVNWNRFRIIVKLSCTDLPSLAFSRLH